MRQLSHLNTALTVIDKFDGREPLAAFLKKFFAADKKYGSGDRRNIAAMCYAFYRLGKITTVADNKERILRALFLCHDKPHPVIEALQPAWNASIHLPLEDKWSLCGMETPIASIFPWKEALSRAVDHEAFCYSMLVQPDLFLRARPGRMEVTEQKLQDAGIVYQKHGTDCIALPNATKLESVLETDRDAVIQDKNSQRVLDYLSGVSIGMMRKVWDCCAASGGKSILLSDIIGQPFSLTVSDIRQSILANLARRFQVAGIKNYRSFIADLSQPVADAGGPYDLLICDAPCTGSGTWSRTPEQLYFFEKGNEKDFHSLQVKIVSNVIPALAPGGIFIYITCSVFEAENEAVIKTITTLQPQLELVEQHILPGYADKADTMFTAVFHKKS